MIDTFRPETSQTLHTISCISQGQTRLLYGCNNRHTVLAHFLLNAALCTIPPQCSIATDRHIAVGDGCSYQMHHRASNKCNAKIVFFFQSRIFFVLFLVSFVFRKVFTFLVFPCSLRFDVSSWIEGLIVLHIRMRPILSLPDLSSHTPRRRRGVATVWVPYRFNINSSL